MSECAHMHMAITEIISLFEGVSKMKEDEKETNAPRYTALQNTTLNTKSAIKFGHGNGIR